VVRLIAVVTFALAFLTQPLALDACALSCEAARAARSATVAAPCHHTASCATQIAQPQSPSSPASTTTAAAGPAVIPLAVAIAVELRVIPVPQFLSYHPPAFSTPPIPLRV